MTRGFAIGLLLVAVGVVAIPFFYHAREQTEPVVASVKTGPAPTPFGWPARIALVAGDGIAGRQDGPIAQARFADPYGVAVDAAGEIYVADAGNNNRIRLIAADGTVSTLAGSTEGFADGVGTAAAFNTPSGVALDAGGNLYVADTGNHAIRKVTKQGIVSTVAGTGIAGFRDGPGLQAQFNGPIGVAVDAQGKIYVADTYNDRVRVIGLDGGVSTLAGGDRPDNQDGIGAAARFDTPCALVVDKDGTVWVADTGNNAIRKVAPNGEVGTFPQEGIYGARADVYRPLSIAITHDGFLYVGEMGRGRVLQFSPAGDMHVLTGASVPGDRLQRLSALAIDAAGALVAADATSARIHRIAAQIPVADIASNPPPQSGSASNPLPRNAGRWPVKPQNAWHEIAGTLGEVRGNDSGESRDHLHDGLDIHNNVGDEVLAIADAKVSSPLSTWRFGELGEGIGLDTLDYIHTRIGRTAKDTTIDPSRFIFLYDESGKLDRVRVRRGARFKAGDVLGTSNAMAHVHLSLDGNVAGRNAMALGFKDFSDTIAPTIDSVEFFDAANHRLNQKLKGRLVLPRDSDGIQIVVDAWDHVDNNLARRRLGLYALGYQILLPDGTPAPGFETPRMNIEFNRMPIDDDAALIAYAENSGETVHGSKATHFRYVVTHIVRDGRADGGSWETSMLAPGDYTVRIIARDYSGNQAKRGSEILVTLQ